jgi:VWFA-related protein
MTRVARVLVVTIAAASSPLPAQAPGPAVVIVHPEARSILSGPSALEADVRPLSTSVRRVTFFVDGQRVCQAHARPFRCEWDAGSRAEARTVRVVADLDGGGRAIGTRRTSPRGLTFGASTDAVLVPVRVMNWRGEFVQGLDATRFALFEDGRPQQVMSMISEGVPASVVLALDMSASMRPKLIDLRRAATLFLEAVRPTDAVTLAGFNESFFPLTHPEADGAARQHALGQLRPWGDTALYDSLIRAAGLLRTQSSPRAIVAFTDGDDVASRASVQTVRSALQTADAVLYLVVGAGAPAPDSPLARLARIADETGGAAWFAPRMETLGRHFTDIVRDLSAGYVLSYLPDRPLGDGAWRELRVELVGPGVGHNVRARQGYLAVQR